MMRPAPPIAAASAAVAAAEPPPAPTAQALSADREVADRLRAWAAAWSAKNVDRYLGFYGASFQPAKSDRSRWMAERRRLVTKPGEIEVDLSEIQARILPDGRVQTDFVQRYRSASFQDSMRKRLLWQRVAGSWVITRETNR
jgi:adhesin transport system outer membrane protein